LLAANPQSESVLPPAVEGMECLVLIDGEYAASMQFRDTPRREGASFVHHLLPKHQFSRILLVSGDRESEVRYLADKVGISHVHFGKSPEEKLQIVRAESKRARTLFVGDGVNDAPALMAATVGVAFGQNSDVTTEAADVVVMDSSLQKIDEFLHISRRMRAIALQSAIGGMALSVLGMLAATTGSLPPVAGALLQECIDVAAVLNALRAAFPPKALRDFER
jgi:P-type E1-E2 ATPase